MRAARRGALGEELFGLALLVGVGLVHKILIWASVVCTRIGCSTAPLLLPSDVASLLSVVEQLGCWQRLGSSILKQSSKTRRLG